MREKLAPRTTLLENLPDNACANLAAFELVQNTIWISKTSVRANNYPKFIDILRRRPRVDRSNFCLGMNELLTANYTFTNPGDPFVALN